MRFLQLSRPKVLDHCNCEKELATQHYRGKWFGFGPVCGSERVMLAVFETTPRSVDGMRLVSKSFTKNLVTGTESVARSQFVSSKIFSKEVAEKGVRTKGQLVGVACADVTQIRALRADLPLIAGGTYKAGAVCVLDLVEMGDYEAHATLGYCAFPAHISNPKTIGKLRERIRLDLATVFSPIIGFEDHNWPSSLEVGLFRIASVVRVVQASRGFRTSVLR
jgi:hypothetical protein